MFAWLVRGKTFLVCYFALHSCILCFKIFLPKTSANASKTQGSDIGLTERSSTRQQTAVPPSQEDEARMREILSDPEVMKVLQDHQIQRLLTMMKTNPEAAQL